MNYFKLQELKNKLYFNIQDVAGLLDITDDSAKVQCSRYYQKGLFLRLKRNFYILKSKWDELETSDFFKITNVLQVPSYISFMTALTFYEVSTQVQRNYFESACIKRTKKYEINEASFNYYILKPDYYFGFTKADNIFIAQKEKALIDCIYMYINGKYKFDMSSIDISKISQNKLKKLLKKYPDKIAAKVKKICGI